MISPLPIEVIDIIIAHLEGMEIALSVCALVSHALSYSARRRQFYQLILNTGQRCVKFSSLLMTSPHLASYVRILHVINEPRTQDCLSFGSLTLECPDSLVSIIAKTAPRIEEFMLRECGFSTTFTSLPPNLQDALLNLFSMPNITTIGLHGLNSIPLGRLVSCSQLEHLVIQHGAKHAEDSLKGCISHYQKVACNLKSLDIGCGLCAQYIANTSSLECLRFLAAWSLPADVLFSLISRAQNSLVELEISEVHSFVPLAGGIDVNICHLTSISLSSTYPSPDLVNDLTVLVTLLEAGPTTTPHALEVVTLNIIGLEDDFDASLLLSNPVWSRLDIVLAQTRYARLKRIYVPMTSLEEVEDCHELSMGERLPSYKPFWRQIPRLWTSKKIRVSWNSHLMRPGTELQRLIRTSIQRDT